MMRLLLHPDLFYSEQSGAVAAREAARILAEMGNEVAVFSHDLPKAPYDSLYRYYKREKYNGSANYFPRLYKQSFRKVIDDFHPDFIFYIGAVVNTPLCYLDLCVEKSIKQIFLFLTQDFYCLRLHAALNTGSCTHCLTGSNFNALYNSCAEKSNRPFLYFLNYQILQRRFRSRLKKLDAVLGSSDEQLRIYTATGINPKNISKIPLFFDKNKVTRSFPSAGNYFVIMGQNRHEKGMHLICGILREVDSGVKVKILFYNNEEASIFKKENPETAEFVKNGILEIIGGITIENGALGLISGSRGVINPTIWATTTEFVLLEALGLAKPVITFDVGIHKEVIINGENGICVPAGDFKGMGREISRLAADLAYYEKISQNAKKLYNGLTDDTTYKSVLNNILQGN
jgi:glycosyltransferase involved in cell wall biosynthesis